ncbi:helix-turn-helix domain-containing protein [Streptomyces xiamenensis]|jgi:AraC-like DNA-binding protein|uniref:Transcriptional regulator, AraC family n=1 Tax=Streptomyces xiamenensis TaxID=408015 RepID=A0A0F7CQ26_9ACTN|nr:MULTISPECIES: AraC family transcriptional regulator [Streptomyces]AKG45676.1 transcriptional regulator, AraC family [Streptomyces xiamenensis]MCU4749397.1 AraC family transcriptional regulator [Streptomyces sp. G-5]QQN77073.1 helix-turn-helix transcriptional regulator [Streptomyces sp. XC 2026]
MREIQVHLEGPPVVTSVGFAIHGPAGHSDHFRLPDLWQLHLYRYEADLTVGGTPHTIRPGRVSLIPPATPCHYRYRGRSEHLYAHLRLPVSGTPRTVPVMQDAGPELPTLSTLMQQAVAAWPSTPGRAAAEIWTALWRVAHLAPAERGDQDAPHPAVNTAVAHIEARLASPLAVPDIARAAGISHTHLTRVFRAATGSTVVAYIRQRRLARARHLLRESTLSISAIAAQVGIPDLQAFNKACRRDLGASPRVLRATRQAPDQRVP